MLKRRKVTDKANNITNKIKISPLTNHKSTTKGAIKGGFDRKNFYEKIKNDQTKNFENMYIFLEDLLKNVWLKQKFKALFDSLLFKIPKISNNSEAVLEFLEDGFGKAILDIGYIKLIMI